MTPLPAVIIVIFIIIIDYGNFHFQRFRNKK